MHVACDVQVYRQPIVLLVRVSGQLKRYFLGGIFIGISVVCTQAVTGQNAVVS